MATKAKTIKLADLSDTIDKAVEASAGRTLPGGTIMGKRIAVALADKIDTKALAREVTKQAQALIPDAKLTPKVLIDDGIITCGFIMKPIKEVIQ